MESAPPFWAKKLSSPVPPLMTFPPAAAVAPLQFTWAQNVSLPLPSDMSVSLTGRAGLEHIAAVESDDRRPGRSAPAIRTSAELLPDHVENSGEGLVPPKPPVATPCCRLTLTPAGACEKSTVLLPPPLMTLPPRPRQTRTAIQSWSRR